MHLLVNILASSKLTLMPGLTIQEFQRGQPSNMQYPHKIKQSNLA